MYTRILEGAFSVGCEEYWSLIDVAAKKRGMSREEILFVFWVSKYPEPEDFFCIGRTTYYAACDKAKNFVWQYLASVPGALSTEPEDLRSKWRPPETNRMKSLFQREGPYQQEIVPEFAVAVAWIEGSLEKIAVAVGFVAGLLEPHEQERDKECTRIQTFFNDLSRETKEGAGPQDSARVAELEEELKKTREELALERKQNEALQRGILEQIPQRWKGGRERFQVLANNNEETAFCCLLDLGWSRYMIGALLGKIALNKPQSASVEDRCDRFIEKASKATRDRYEQYKTDEKERNKTKKSTDSFIQKKTRSKA